MSDLDCLAPEGAATRTVHGVRPEGLAALLAGMAPDRSAFLRDAGFAAAAGEVALLPGPGGVTGAVLGLGTQGGPHAFGALPMALPVGDWTITPGGFEPNDAVLGFCLGAYRYRRSTGRAPARLLPTAGTGPALATARAAWLVRDLVNAPANLLGPAELAAAAGEVAARFGAAFETTTGAALAAAYPAIAAVGRGSARPPVVATLRWAGSGAGADAPLVSLCGKGVCFDSGGYDLKPAAGMLRMKKDMGGAAILLGLAQMVMAADLPVRLVLRLGCVENSVSGEAMRPLDVLATRRGLSVEVGNTDAEGRLVLCDLLAEASDERPRLLLDAATLTGAARVALGPDLPALFCNDEAFASALLESGQACNDPLWRLPLWAGYDAWLTSPVADLNNVAGKPGAGAIVAALFLQRFLAPSTAWAHLDVYAWNDSTRPGRPEGGEAQGMRAAFGAILRIVHPDATNRNTWATYPSPKGATSDA